MTTIMGAETSLHTQRLKEDLDIAHLEIQRLQTELVEERSVSAAMRATAPLPPPPPSSSWSPETRRRSEPSNLATSIFKPLPSSSDEPTTTPPNLLNSSSSSTSQRSQSLRSSTVVVRDDSENLRLVEMLGSDMDIKLALRHVESQSQQTLRCQRVVLWLVESESHRLWPPSMGGNVIISPGNGIPGYVAKMGEMLRVDDVMEDARFTNEVRMRRMMMIGGKHNSQQQDHHHHPLFSSPPPFSLIPPF